jgi:hypothetical protein
LRAIPLHAGAQSKGDAMNKVIVILLAAVFAAAGLTAQKATAQEKEAKKAVAAAKGTKVHGVIIRIDKDASTMDVKATAGKETRVYYSEATKWTRLTKPADMSIFKENVTVTCAGKYDEEGKFRATQCDLRHE